MQVVIDQMLLLNKQQVPGVFQILGAFSNPVVQRQ